MNKLYRPTLKKLDGLVMAADLAIIILAGIFRPGSLPWVIPAAAVVISLYALVIRRSLRSYGIMLMVTGLSVALALPANWLYTWWDQRGLREEFEQQSAAALVINRSILDQLQGTAELEKLRQLALEYSKSLHAEQTIAQLEIPRIGINSIIVEGTEESSLRKGPGHLEETPIPGMQGNFAVAGDRVLYGGPFLNLDGMEPGDEIFVKTPYGKFEYEVTNKAITDPEDVSILRSNGTEVITLITCDPPWSTSHRLVIQGKMTSASLL